MEVGLLCEILNSEYKERKQSRGKRKERKGFCCREMERMKQLPRRVEYFTGRERKKERKKDSLHDKDRKWAWIGKNRGKKTRERYEEVFMRKRRKTCNAIWKKKPNSNVVGKTQLTNNETRRYFRGFFPIDSNIFIPSKKTVTLATDIGKDCKIWTLKFSLSVVVEVGRVDLLLRNLSPETSRVV